MKETPKQYSARILGYVEGRPPLAVQAATPRKLVTLTRRLTSRQLRKRPAPGKWSICEILAHLAECEIVHAYRIRAILGKPGGPIQAFDQDVWAHNSRYNRVDPAKSLETFAALRKFNLALLKSLTPEKWKRYGVHSERGKESVKHYTRLIAGHDLNHLGQIARLAARR